MRLLIAETLFIVRLGLSRIAATMPVITVIHEADMLDNATALMDVSPFELLILDPHLPGFQLQVVTHLKMRYPGLRILIYSEQPGLMFAKSYFQAGADGYLEKKALEEEIRQAFHTVLSGGKYAHYSLRHQLVTETAGADDNPLLKLSPREIAVMELISQGQQLSAVASALHLKAATVSTYKSRIFEKLGVSNILELVKMIEQYRLKN